MSKRISRETYRERMRAIKQHVDFNYAGGSHRTKVLITRYYNQIQTLKQRGFIKQYTPRSVKSRRLIKDATGTKLLPHMKHALIDRHIDNIRIRKDEVIITRSGLKEHHRAINTKELASHTRRELERITKHLGGDKFRIQAGKYILPGTHNRAGLIKEAERLMSKYENWDEWLNIVAVEYAKDD